MQLLEDALERPVDLGIGYLLEAPQVGDLVQGAYLELAAPLTGHTRPSGWRTRLLGTFSVESLFDRSHGGTRIGAGATAGLLFEGATMVGGEDFSTLDGGDRIEKGKVDVIGLAYGESAVGLYLAASARQGIHEPYWLVAGGLSLRAPATFGALILWLVG